MPAVEAQSNRSTDNAALPHPELLDDLNASQHQAVVATKGPVLVVAGAGSGKTRVLIKRIAHLIQNHEVPPENILGITFTRKAAGEMRDRLARGLGREAAEKVDLLTFHALGVAILREYGSVAGLAGRFGVADEYDVGERIRTVLGTMGIKRSAAGETPREVQDRIGTAKAALADAIAREAIEDPAAAADALVRYRGDVDWGPFEGLLVAPDLDRFAEQYRQYQAGLSRDNVVDFDDLVNLPLMLFLQRPEMGRLVAAEWEYVMVDEYQDTDFAQDHLLRILTRPHGNLCVVGDAAQSIYSWRNAKIENIQTFSERYSPCTVVTLDRNYRSTPDILDVANAVLEKRPEITHEGNQLWTSNDAGPPPRVWTCMTQEAEANAIAEDVAGALDSGAISSLNDVLVLYRKNALARPIETALQRQQIPYRVVNSTSLLERKEVRDIIAFLRVAQNPRDQANFERAAMAIACGVGPQSLEALSGFSRVSGVPILQVAREADESTGLRPKQAASVRDLAALIDRIGSAGQESGGRAVHLALEETGVRQDLIEALARAEAEEDDEQAEALLRRIHDIDDFTLYVEEVTRPSKSEPDSLTLAQLLDGLAFLSPGDRPSADDDECLTLMSIHAAKGLEAPRVYVVGLEEGVFPSHNGVDVIDDEGQADEHMAEEARLFYVAVTRAEKQLVLSAARTREVYRGDPRPMIRSRFLSSLPEMGYRPETQR